MKNEDSPIILDDNADLQNHQKILTYENEEELFKLYERFEKLADNFAENHFDLDEIPPVFEANFENQRNQEKNEL